MHNPFRIVENKHVISYRFTAILLAVLFVCLFPKTILSASVDDQQVAEFFHSVQESFRDKDVNEIVEHIHADFSYIMTYSTNDNFSVLESDYEKYRANVGAFFKSKPDILEYSIIVDDIQRFGEDINVLARIKSVVKLNDVINSCDASSNYTVQFVKDEFLIKNVRGDATCINEYLE